MFPPQNGAAQDTTRAASGSNGSAAPQTRVPAVLKAFKLLEAVSLSDKPLGVSELSRKLQMGKSTVHGLVTTLETLGVLEAVNGSKRYVLGPRLFALASRSGNQADLRQVARAALERLAAATEQTSFLGVPSDGQVTILDIVHGRPTLSISAPVGSSIPLLAGAVGKVVLSSWEPERRRAFLADNVLPAFTPASIVTPQFYEDALEETLARGAAIDVDEYVDGVRAAAAAVTGPQRQLVAVLWVAGFSRHIDGQRLDAIAAAVIREAAEISARLGTSSEMVAAEKSL
jgi:IclR family transcriptional regulator, KDG regulon repressor